jgi:hypothetical protein
MEEKENACRILVGRQGGRRLLGRSRCRWEDNMELDLREIGCSVMDWIDVPKGRDQ